MKKFIAKLLIIACLVTSIGPIPELNVQAATTERSAQTIKMVAGQKFQLEPEQDVVSWKSSRPGIVSVDENGLITAIVYDRGEVTITGTHADETTETFTVQLLKPVISEYDMDVTLDQNEREYISLNKDGYGTITCSSDDPSIVTASMTTVSVQLDAKMPGETTVRVYTEVGQFQIKVTVEDDFKFYSEDTWVIMDAEDVYLTLPDDFRDYVWTNSNPEVLELKAYRQYKYEMIPKKPGNSVVTVTNEYGQTATTVVHVYAPIPDLQFEEHDVVVYLGSTYPLKINATPSLEESNNKLTFNVRPYYSSQKDALEVTADGVVIPYKTCTDYIVSMYAYGNASGYDECYVSVKKPYFSKSYYEINKYQTVDLKQWLNCGDCEVVWESADESVATVDQNGIMTAVGKQKDGKANITTITATCGGYEAEINIEVLLPYISNKTVSLFAKETKTVKVNRAVGTVTWKSSNTAVATVDKNGKITAKKAGTATITGTVHGDTFTCKVTVKQPALNVSKKTLIAKQTYKLSVKGAVGKVKWSTSKKSVATVSSSGTITAKKAGTAYIYAKVDGKTLKCKVTVKANQITYKVNKDVYDYRYGTPTVVLGKAYYSGSSLKADVYVMNNRRFSANKFTWITYKIYDNNGKLVASKKFKNIRLGIRPYGYKKITLTFSGSSLKKKNAILNNGVSTKWEYYYTYTIQ